MRKFMQMEIDQLKEHISDVAKNTQFNKINLLDGSMADSHVASNADGSGMKKNQLLEQYKLAMLKKKLEDDEDGAFRLIRK